MTNPTLKATNQRSAAAEPWSAVLVGVFAYAFRTAQRSLAPVLELAIRIGLAQVFFVSGVLKFADWDNALFLAANEYPVAWLNPVAAAWLGVAVELLGSTLLAAGLATRTAAGALLALAVVIQTSYLALDQHLFWIALLGWFVTRGAGALSLDHMLRRGLADSALPFAAGAIDALAKASRLCGPAWQLLLRLWLATAIVTASIGGATVVQVAAWLPLREAAGFGGATAVIPAVLLAIGLGTRFAAVALIVLWLIGRMALGTDVASAGELGRWLGAFGLLVLAGPGAMSVDALIARGLRMRFPQLVGKPAFSLHGLPRVVIVGAGFGGLACAARLARTRVSVTLIDRHNYHLFQPLLYQVATASLSPGDIATPVRGLFRDHFNTRVLHGEVRGVDTARQEVLVDDARITYDYLVLATGAAHSYFGRDDWGAYAPGLKRVEDATEVRRRLLSAFERAEATEDLAEQRALLTFLIVGGGPTGVELAGAIAELARFGMEKDFRRFDPASARIVLVQAGERILPTFPEALSAATQRSLEKLGVEVLLNSRVETIDDDGVSINGQRIASRTVLWAAGVVASPAARWLGAEADNAGRIKVGADLSVPGLPNVFAVGDTALTHAWNGGPVPGLAPAAKQGGEYVARVIRNRIEGGTSLPPFVYRHLGSLATIGRKAAVADFGFVRLTGALAWWLWGAVHVAFLVDLRSRMSVMFDWFWAYLTYRSGTRLITGAASPAAPARQQVAEPVLYGVSRERA